MEITKYLSKDKVSLEDILNARDLRQSKQLEYTNTYHLPLVVFTLNIVGPIKVFPLTIKTFHEGVRLIKETLALHELLIIQDEINFSKCGYEAYFMINNQPKKIKKCLLEIEDDSVLGRLFDIDVLDAKGNKISRLEFNKDFRKCLICNNIAYECSRSRKHSIEEILNKEIQMMVEYFNDKYADNLAKISLKALMFELNTTPKPGLVDLNNNGSHSDMNVELFRKSANSVFPFFKKFVYCGINNSEFQLCDIFEELRNIGIEAESEMFKATNNINTHKGSIFTFAIVLSTIGWLYANNIDYSRTILINSIMDLTKNIKNDFINLESKKELSNGELLYLKYNISGIRGEAIKGFSSVINNSLLVFDSYLKNDYSYNDSGVITLLELILLIEDTNIIKRSNYETLIRIKKEINKFKSSKSEDFIAFSHALDNEYIDLNISPGGSADLLALTYFIHFFEQSGVENLLRIKS